GPKWLQKRHLYKKNFYVDYDLRTMVQIRILAHEGACSRGTPEYGARSGVPRRRLVTVVSGGTGPRPPGTTTRTRGARCDRSGARRSASLGELPVREARDRSLKSPRWSAGRRASRVMGRKAPRQAPGLPRYVQAHGCRASTRRLSALRHPFNRGEASEGNKT